MLNKIKNNQTLKMLINSHNLGLYLLVIIALSVTWSSIKVIQKNYGLEKQITRLQQEVDVLDQQNKNQELKNQYYNTNAFLDLAARKYFGLANPGEKLILVPDEVAQKYVHPAPKSTLSNKPTKPKSHFVQNFQDWINFFLHRQQS
ncbi:MAG TPA: septum formation initiator family protein [Patescibacteria group bacterium]|nr:septum formation initiator family protein [Patescibacteria group bacterium]